MKETGLMIKLMVLEFIFILMERGMKVPGEMTYNMAKEKRPGQTDQFMKESIKWERSMVMEFTIGMMGQDMKENG